MDEKETQAKDAGITIYSVQDVFKVVEQTMLHMDKRQRVLFLGWFKKTKNRLDLEYPLGYRAVETRIPTETPPTPAPSSEPVAVVEQVEKPAA